MSENIKLFVWLCVASTLISIAGTPFGPPKIRNEKAYWSMAVFVLTEAFFVYVAAWGRENWGRWAVVAAIVLCVPGFVLIVKRYSSQFPVFVGMQTISMVWNMAALYYVFSGDAQQWFK